jgi:poly(A) polymerase
VRGGHETHSGVEAQRRFVGFLGVDPTGQAVTAAQPMKCIGNEGLPQPGSLASDRNSQPLKVSLTLGLAGYGITEQLVVARYPQSCHRRCSDRLVEAISIQLPERLEGFFVEFQNAQPVPGGGAPKAERAGRAVGEREREVSLEKVKCFSFNETCLTELVSFGGSHRGGYHGSKTLPVKVLDCLSERHRGERGRVAQRNEVGNVGAAAPPSHPKACRLNRKWIRPHGWVHDTRCVNGATLQPCCSPFRWLAGSTMTVTFGASLNDALEAVGPLAERFASAGYRLYLVGGVVRDDLMGRVRPDNDYDLTTDARPDAIRALVAEHAEAVWAQGERFGTIGCRIAGRDYEITTHRSDAYGSTSRKPEVVFGDSIEVDLSRRDFTVNSLAVDTVSGELFDPFGGVDDLQAGILRTPSGPDISFSDDPLRMVRAARFIATLGLEPSEDVVFAAQELRSRLGIVAVERIREELDKMLRLPDPQPGLAFLCRCGLLTELLPGLARLDAAQVGAKVGRVEDRPEMRWAALLSDLAPDLAVEELRRLKPSSDLVTAVTWFLRSTGWSGSVGVPTTREQIRRLAASTPEGQSLEDLFSFAKLLGDSPDELVEAVELLASLRVEEPDLDRPMPPLSGDQIANLLRVEPGTVLGQAHRMLLEHRFVHGPVSDDQAELLVRSWFDERQTSAGS